MAMAQSAAIACLLLDRGWSRGTPAAIVVDATRPEQQVWRGTLNELASEQLEFDTSGAGTIVIGDVVNVGSQAQVVGLEGPRYTERIAGRSS